jgi:L-alanine-DL-glutamate epimerase-like enolase superfamily enzyme
MALVHPLTSERGLPPIYACDYRDGLIAVDENGHVPVPTGPGLGVTYDWNFIMENRKGGRVYE